MHMTVQIVSLLVLKNKAERSCYNISTKPNSSIAAKCCRAYVFYYCKGGFNDDITGKISTTM